MLPISIQLPEQFLNEEERCGYLVTEKMKKVWAIQLDLLSALQLVCKEYDLRYYADSGTLLGAVRHSGFIPWDDDIDIVMPRADYDKLVSIGQKVFKAPIFLQNAYSDSFVRSFSRLRNSKTTALIKNDLRSDCNKGIFIDIFPIDFVPENFSEQYFPLKRIKTATNLVRVGVTGKSIYYNSTIDKMICIILNSIFRIVDYRRYMKHIDSLITNLGNENSPMLSNVTLGLGKKWGIWPKEIFDRSCSHTFEFTSIAVPEAYDDYLQLVYGSDYMIPKHSKTSHGFTILEPDIPFEEYLKTHTYEEIEQYINEMDS